MGQHSPLSGERTCCPNAVPECCPRENPRNAPIFHVTANFLLASKGEVRQACAHTPLQSEPEWREGLGRNCCPSTALRSYEALRGPLGQPGTAWDSLGQPGTAWENIRMPSHCVCTLPTPALTNTLLLPGGSGCCPGAQERQHPRKQTTSSVIENAV